MKSVQLLPYRGGQATMSIIFGPEADRELFSPNNGILVSSFPMSLTMRARRTSLVGMILIDD